MTAEVPYETTLRIRDECLCLHVQRSARALGRYFDEALRPVGLTNGQFSLLMALNRPVPPSVGAVARLLGADRTTLTAAIKPLERRGLLGTGVDPADRRSRLLTLTAKGHEALAAAIPIWNRQHAKIDALIGGDADAMRRSLRALEAGVP